MNEEQRALNDAWTEAVEMQNEHESLASCMEDLAERIAKTRQWDPALKALRRAELASRRAAETLAQLIPTQ